MSLTPQQISALFRLGADAMDGRLKDPGELSRALVDLGLSFVPVGELAPFLAAASERRVELAVDVVEDAKFPPE